MARSRLEVGENEVIQCPPDTSHSHTSQAENGRAKPLQAVAARRAHVSARRSAGDRRLALGRAAQAVRARQRARTAGWLSQEGWTSGCRTLPRYNGPIGCSGNGKAGTVPESYPGGPKRLSSPRCEPRAVSRRDSPTRRPRFGGPARSWHRPAGRPLLSLLTFLPNMVPESEFSRRVWSAWIPLAAMS